MGLTSCSQTSHQLDNHPTSMSVEERRLSDLGMRETWSAGYFHDRTRVRAGTIRMTRDEVIKNQGRWVAGFAWDTKRSFWKYTAVYVPKGTKSVLIYRGP